MFELIPHAGVLHFPPIAFVEEYSPWFCVHCWSLAISIRCSVPSFTVTAVVVYSFPALFYISDTHYEAWVIHVGGGIRRSFAMQAQEACGSRGYGGVLLSSSLHGVVSGP
jgi:hypothetical protein